ncbi:uncharacterized protein LOC133298221 [Gastrolobium bilobum]|uniref:uncharacterized protein LOC133298221 n=1 Tax=Gastrolobium bilobum TaxID=150636 RepID=UPI002AB11ACF|nr:uncharacterized protein LOC133298221 [Gastrolobium bilobum]
MVITSASDWRQTIVAYLEKGTLPEDRLESRKLVRDATQYTIVNDQLFRKGLHVPMLKCLNADEAEYVLGEIHEEINGHHMRGKALARKALRAGYYWPVMQADSKDHVKRCKSCQKHAKIPAEVVTDNETQFADKRFQHLMKDLQVKHCFASVEHPQSNGQAEAANKNYYPNRNGGNPFSANIWLRSYDPSRNWRTFLEEDK